ncbi:hypothetical protein TREMEDRAFT_27247 [Tremella mesenterica DSM 1558]|uniref:uncharacterized protein n=1 Tax=Tremella mesenterica (strain ATCC 24925 / CBS 8224 / DSM 1558 / NBRC 9311 / NRRL Y-6157 / RJB 2259-6 / UBC 559-6) TaxID=578456 RepID=UPI0003F49893|nr:uncharacterized protein TREMEDRAFT_27247 [Tremella mesenterica DSM 1558]EIW71417.1 hypothetical protein TREMEDRAFT_27247 [Tremella mesenterica DSM 1558]
MADQLAINQLREMGIPRARAKAALLKSKGDAMSAAEKVFAGDFDDIPSDDDDTSSHDNDAISSVNDQGDAESYYEQDMEMEDFDELTEDGDGTHGTADPYANVFFSKDRTEVIRESKEETRRVTMPPAKLPILSRGEWMSGCPEGSEQSFLFQLYHGLQEPVVTCASCKQHSFTRSGDDFFACFPDFEEYIMHVAGWVQQTCPKCSVTTCLACGEKVDIPRHHDPRSKTLLRTDNIERDELLHCPDLQGVVIGMGLHTIQKQFAENRRTHTSPQSSITSYLHASQSNSLFGQPSPIPDDLDEDEDDYGFASKGPVASGGVGYGGTHREDRSGQLAVEEAQRVMDGEFAKLLGQVRIYLPSYRRASGARTSDHLVHPTALAHLRRRSGFVNELLRNDSLLGMSNRFPVYDALLDWLEVISSHESLASMLAMPCMVPVRSQPVATGPGEEQQIEVVYEGSPSPRELLENCVIQAQSALKGIDSTNRRIEPAAEDATKGAERQAEKLPWKDDTGLTELKTFCERIISSAKNIDASLVQTKGSAFVERMRQSLPRLPESGVKVEELEAGDNEIDVIRIYEEWAGRASFQYCDLTRSPAEAVGDADTSVQYDHHYDSSIRSLNNVTAPKRSLAIAKELAILTTNIPVAWHSSIFLRVDEGRVDCIKAMIIGPEGTPYENGCFLFDIFLPLDYNWKCPSVHYMTTNGGKYRYNPNLYADGKVCLSLLGTWNGPGWIAGKSTLLQVLISIQSLIFCEKPYDNEPGWESSTDNAAREAYSANVRRMVVKDAMANNLRNPPAAFESEIKTHFRLKARSLRAQLDK